MSARRVLDRRSERGQIGHGSCDAERRLQGGKGATGSEPSRFNLSEVQDSIFQNGIPYGRACGPIIP